MKWRLVILVGLVLCLPINAQMQAGTIVYVQWSQDEIVLAADSRFVRGDSYSDTSCKIGVVGSDIVFGGSGKQGRVGPDGVLEWTGSAVAGQEFLRLSKEGASYPPTLKSLAEAWGRAMKIELEKGGPAIFVGLGKDRIIASGFFARFDNGTLSTMVEDVSAEPSANGNYKIVLSNKVPDKTAAFFMGHNEIIQELVAHQTEEARQWLFDLRKAMEAASDPLAAGTIEVVQLTIDHLPKTLFDKNGIPFSVVGPPVAAVRLRRNNSVEWIQKGKCP